MLFEFVGRVQIIDVPPANAIPPGLAGEHIREKFLGLKLCPVPEKELRANPPPPLMADAAKRKDGYIVRRSDCIEALKVAGRYGAAHFWASLGIGHYLLFPKEVCEPVGWLAWLKSFWRDGCLRMFRPY